MPTQTSRTKTPYLLQAIDLLSRRADSHIADPESRSILRGVLNQTRLHVSDAANMEETIHSNPHLSDTGKKDELAKHATKKLPILGPIRKLLSEVQAEVQQRRADLFAVKKYDGPHGMEDRLDQREIRDAFNRKPAAEIIRAFQEAVKSGNMDVQRAFMTGPLGPLLDKEIAQRMLEGHAKQARPAEYQKLQAGESLRDHVAALEQQTTEWLLSLGANPTTTK